MWLLLYLLKRLEKSQKIEYNNVWYNGSNRFIRNNYDLSEAETWDELTNIQKRIILTG